MTLDYAFKHTHGKHEKHNYSRFLVMLINKTHKKNIRGKRELITTKKLEYKKITLIKNLND